MAHLSISFLKVVLLLIPYLFIYHIHLFSINKLKYYMIIIIISENVFADFLISIFTSPLGKKSNPTIDSSKELFPLLYVPRTTILGSVICLSRPMSLILSIMLINLRRFSSNDIIFKYYKTLKLNIFI